jgi:hypothetical protein
LKAFRGGDQDVRDPVFGPNSTDGTSSVKMRLREQMVCHTFALGSRISLAPLHSCMYEVNKVRPPVNDEYFCGLETWLSGFPWRSKSAIKRA